MYIRLHTVHRFVLSRESRDRPRWESQGDGILTDPPRREQSSPKLSQNGLLHKDSSRRLQGAAAYDFEEGRWGAEPPPGNRYMYIFCFPEVKKSLR